jgi:hypothetical protein
MSGFEGARAYLGVERFMVDMVSARALSSALETGVIDRLHALGPCRFEVLLASVQADADFDAPGLQFLLGLLQAGGVVAGEGGQFSLTAGFEAALPYRDLLEAKLYLAQWVASDFLQLFTALLVAPQKFMQQARLFQLFDYQRCYEATPANYAHTAAWMRVTTALTKYEAQACLEAYDFSGHRRLLDIGGNSGEFALRVCRAHPALHATVYDLPLVCDLGQAHVAPAAEAARLNFVKLGSRQEALPRGYDLITFKSMLHDWPASEMQDFLQRAYAALDDGGSLLIFERSEFKAGAGPVAYGQLPLVLFFRSYRPAQVYVDGLKAVGFHRVVVTELQLDMPFVLICATK